MCVPTCVPGRSRLHTLYASDEEGSGRQGAVTAGRPELRGGSVRLGGGAERAQEGLGRPVQCLGTPGPGPDNPWPQRA